MGHESGFKLELSPKNESAEYQFLLAGVLDRVFIIIYPFDFQLSEDSCILAWHLPSYCLVVCDGCPWTEACAWRGSPLKVGVAGGGERPGAGR